jgi:hypothetical protein
VENSLLKGLDPMKHGKEIRKVRLKGHPEPLSHVGEEIYALELWKRIVEVYSRSSLTKPEDKLVALSGIAKMMASMIGSEVQPAEYVAGLWSTNIESQLLWRVEPVYQELDKSFEYKSTRPIEFRAPSFTWAAVNADSGHGGNGILYAEATYQSLYIKVYDFSISTRSDNKYGMIKGGNLQLWGKLRRVRLIKRDRGQVVWRLEDRPGQSREEGSKIYRQDDEEHANIDLDCYEDGLFRSRDIYCMPAARGGLLGSGDDTYLICLLLQSVRASGERGVFRRIGLTKLSIWADKMTYTQILDVEERDISLPCQEYHKETGFHLVKIV